MKEIEQHQIFDNAFLSGCAWHKRLMIPLVNEIFGKDIPLDAYIERSANEQFKHGKNSKNEDVLIKRITDSLVKVGNRNYHLECESKNDGQILIRIGDYDMQIAMSDAIYDNHTVRMELPDTAVIFLRNHYGLPPSGRIIYRKGKAELTHTIPFFEVGNHSLEYLSDNYLFLLFPFYIMRYEHAIKNTPGKYEMIEREAKAVYDNLTDAYGKARITKIEYENIITLCIDVVSEITKDVKFRERLVNIMGNEVLLTAEERGLDKGLKALVNSLKKHCDNFQSLYKEVISNEEYRHCSEEQVKKYYN